MPRWCLCPSEYGRSLISPSSILFERDLLNTLELVSVSETPVSLKPRYLQYVARINILSHHKYIKHAPKKKLLKKMGDCQNWDKIYTPFI